MSDMVSLFDGRTYEQRGADQAEDARAQAWAVRNERDEKNRAAEAIKNPHRDWTSTPQNDPDFNDPPPPPTGMVQAPS